MSSLPGLATGPSLVLVVVGGGQIRARLYDTREVCTCQPPPESPQTRTMGCVAATLTHRAFTVTCSHVHPSPV